MFIDLRFYSFLETINSLAFLGFLSTDHYRFEYQIETSPYKKDS